MARPAQSLQVTVFIGTPMCFRGNVVNRLSSCGSALSQTLLTEMTITLKNSRTSDIPLAAISPLMSAQSALMLLPALIDMVSTVTRAVCGCPSTTVLTARSRYSLRHPVSTPCGAQFVVYCRGGAQPSPCQRDQPVNSMGTPLHRRMRHPQRNQQASHDSSG